MQDNGEDPCLFGFFESLSLTISANFPGNISWILMNKIRHMKDIYKFVQFGLPWLDSKGLLAKVCAVLRNIPSCSWCHHHASSENIELLHQATNQPTNTTTLGLNFWNWPKLHFTDHHLRWTIPNGGRAGTRHLPRPSNGIFPNLRQWDKSVIKKTDRIQSVAGRRDGETGWRQTDRQTDGRPACLMMLNFKWHLLKTRVKPWPAPLSMNMQLKNTENSSGHIIHVDTSIITCMWINNM